MNTVTQMREEQPLVKLNHQLATRADQFRMVLPNHITVEKFQRTVLTAVQNDPQLLEADRQSFLLSCMKAAQDGLLPDKREAALVIFKENKQVNGQWETRLLVQYMPMVYGLRKKILQSAEVADITTNVVYRAEVESGAFYYEEGTERALRHKPLLLDFDPQDNDIIAAYSVATFKDGSRSFEVMRRSEINKVREKSQTGATVDKKGNARKPSGPWVDWFSEQCRKTVLRRHSKSLPMSGDLIDVEASDEIAAASAQNVLAAPQAPPAAVEAPPTRAGIAQQPVENVIDTSPVATEAPDLEAARQVAAQDESLSHIREQPAHDEDGVVKEETAQTEAEPEYDDAAFDVLQGRVNRSSTVGALNRVVSDIEGHPALKPEWRETLLKNAEIKRAELAGGAR